MHLKIKLFIKIAVDIILLCLFIMVMGYHILDNQIHEIIGLNIFIFFIIHTALNIKWYLKLFKGKYSLTRIYQTIINFSLLVLMILIIASSLMISLSLFPSFDFTNVRLGRSLHLVCTIWTFILMSAHLGNHIKMLKNIFMKKIKINKICNWIIRIVFIVGAIFGIIVLIDRKLYEAMFNLTEFFYLPYGESVVKFIFDYVSIMILFATISFYVNSFLSYLQKKILIKKLKINNQEG